MKGLLGALVISTVMICGSGSVIAEPGNADRPRQVQIDGCVTPGVEFRCLVVKSGGGTYDVTALGAKVGDRLLGTATLANRITTCMQGVTVVAFRDAKTPRPRCAADGVLRRLDGDPTSDRPQ